MSEENKDERMSKIIDACCIMSIIFFPIILMYLAYLTEAMKPWLPFGYLIAFSMGIITVLWIRLQLKDK